MPRLFWCNIMYFRDFMSDVMFASRTYEQEFYQHCLVASCFIVIPWLLNMRQLMRSITKWSNDRTIKDRVDGWIINYNLYLIGLAALSGSAFSAIEICNSQSFGIEFFNMVCTKHVFLFTHSVPQLSVKNSKNNTQLNTHRV